MSAVVKEALRTSGSLLPWRQLVTLDRRLPLSIALALAHDEINVLYLDAKELNELHKLRPRPEISKVNRIPPLLP